MKKFKCLKLELIKSSCNEGIWFKIEGISSFIEIDKSDKNGNDLLNIQFFVYGIINHQKNYLDISDTFLDADTGSNKEIIEMIEEEIEKQSFEIIEKLKEN